MDFIQVLNNFPRFVYSEEYKKGIKKQIRVNTK